MTWTDDDVRRLAVSEARQELLEEIMSTPTLETIDDTTPAKRQRPKWLVASVAAAAVLAVIGVPVLIAGLGSDGVAEYTGYSSQVIEQAEKSNRVLIGEPGWEITYVDGFGDAEGEMRFEKDGRELDVHWRAADSYASYVEDRNDIGEAETVSLLGEASKLWSYSGDDFTAIRPADGGSFLEVRGGVGDKAAYLSVLGSLELVGVQEWLDALPSSVVQPGERGEEVAEILQGMPLPAGFEVEVTNETSERYHVIADVTGQVACAWIDVWRNGGPHAKAEAVGAAEAMRTWPALLEIEDEGDWSEVLWEITGEMKTGTLNPEYAQGLGCD